jgi:glucose/arabinose dehydrogenase
LEVLEDRFVPSVPFVVGGDPRVNPADFQITTFATGLDFPYGMVQLADGSLLVAESTSPSGSYFRSVGELVRLVDADGDGIADGPGTVLYTGLPGSVTALCQAGNLFFVTSSQGGSERISVLRAGATPASPLTLLGSLDFTFPTNWEHTTYESAVRPTPWEPGDFDLFFNVGAGGNTDSPPGPIPLGGLISASLNVDSIYKVTVHDTGGTPILSNLTQVAAGLRNAAGMAFQPGTGDLYLEDNGTDGPGNPGEELGADTLHVVAAAGIGTSVPDFGFPNSYIDYFSGKQVGTGGTPPLVAFLPTPAPATGAELAGATQVAFAPRSFPTGLNDGVFVGFHGGFNDGGPANDENPLVYVDLHTKKYFPFIASSLPGVGHLDGLLTTNNALYVADLSSTGDLFGSGTPQHTGVIYRIAPAHATLTVDQSGGPGIYTTIQAAVNDASAGDTIEVHAGTYRENVTISKPLTLVGPNAGVNPNTQRRKPEAVVVPGTDNAASGTIFTVTASHVTIDGFTIDGHNGFLTGTALPITGVLTSAANGISNGASKGYLNDGTFIDHLIVRDDIIRNLSINGVVADLPKFNNQPSGDNIIRNNRIDDIPSMATGTAATLPGANGIFLRENFYAAITGNVLTRVGNGIREDEDYSPNPDANAPPLVDGNTVTDFYIHGIYHNKHFDDATPWTISNNNLTADAAHASPVQVGLEVLTVTVNVGVTIQNNNVTGARVGVEFWNDSPDGVTVQGGTIAGSKAVGILALPKHPVWGEFGTGLQTVRLVGVTVTRSGFAGVEVDGNPDVPDPAAHSSTMVLYRDTITHSGTYGVYVAGGAGLGTDDQHTEQNIIAGNPTNIFIDPRAGTVQPMFDNNLSGATRFALSNGKNSTLEASANWWGTNTRAGVRKILSGSVDYTPFLNSGKNTRPPGTPGFLGDFAFLNVDAQSPELGSDPRIQEGIDLVAPGGIVRVLDGSYAESDTVTRSITVEGVGDTTVVRPPNGNGFTVSLSGADAVTLRDFKVTGPANDGILFTGGASTTLHVHDATLTGLLGSGVEVNGGSAFVTRSVLADNTNGALLDAGFLQLRLNDIHGNSSFGVLNESPTHSQVDAVRNYWGDRNGPTDVTGGNPNPTSGDKVSAFVTYAPWAVNPAGAVFDRPQIVQGNLVVPGTDGNDFIRINVVGTTLTLILNRKTYHFSTKSLKPSTGHLVIYGFAGNDRIVVRGSVPAEIHLGDGNNVVHGGDGGNVVFGGNGFNVIQGGAGNDLLFSGGNGLAIAGTGNTTLVAGTAKPSVNGQAVTYDQLKGYAAAWASSRTVDPNLVADVTTSPKTRLLGGLGHDWFIAASGSQALNYRPDKDHLTVV